MKNKRKLRFKIWVLFSVALFLLIPLLSSPVAAAFTLNVGTAYTNNVPAGPSATGNINVPTTITDSSPFNANFVVDCNYNDNNEGGSGSNHWVEVIVRWQPQGTGAWQGPNTYTQAAIPLAAGPASWSGPYTTPTLTGYGGIGTNFQVEVKVYCYDILTTTTASWSSGVKSFTIV
jgi:hypothetical protein